MLEGLCLHRESQAQGSKGEMSGGSCRQVEVGQKIKPGKTERKRLGNSESAPRGGVLLNEARMGKGASQD